KPMATSHVDRARGRLTLLGALLLPFLSACSVILAATDAPKVHYQTIGVGTPRRVVIEVLGPPSHTDAVQGGGQLDRFDFKSGIGDRALRATGWGLADILTLGIAELFATPFEAVKRADAMHAEVLFDSSDFLVAMEIRKEKGEPVAVAGDTRRLAEV